MKTYELWLDESGDFEREQQKKLNGLFPSLIGGILIEAEKAKQIDYDALIQPDKNHAVELQNKDIEKVEYILPVLESVREAGGVEVFFENSMYEDAKNNRTLYLRIMAEGILQLLQNLNARNEAVQLNVLIARRQDPTKSQAEERIIQPHEYDSMFLKLIKQKMHNHKIALARGTKATFSIDIAQKTQKLILADYACNTRITRKSRAFREVQERIESLYSDAYIYSLTEIPSENYIVQSLAKGYVADAILELYTSYDLLDVEMNRGVIIEKINNMNYRQVKAQMKKCAKNLNSMIADESDYGTAERLLKRIEQLVEVFPDDLRQLSIELEYNIVLNLVDMYLREGNMAEARKALDKCYSLHANMGDCLETILPYYQLIEKEAVYRIDSCDYVGASQLMQAACDLFRHTLKFVMEEPLLQKRYSGMKSEYYGDALCMLIYAMLFRQRFEPELYEEMRQYSDLAMRQYPDNEGELERHRQYRSRMEAEAGNCEEALRWLILAKEYHCDAVNEDSIRRFLDDIHRTEGETSTQYYLMYYLLIMEAALRCDMKSFAKMMLQVLYDQHEILERFGLKEPTPGGANPIQLSVIRQDMNLYRYHPMEMIQWKYAVCMLELQPEVDADEVFGLLEEAIEVAHASYKWVTMRIVGVGIEAERIALLLQQGKTAMAEAQLIKLHDELDEIEALCNEETNMHFVQEVRKLLPQSLTAFDSERIEQLHAIARRITY